MDHMMKVKQLQQKMERLGTHTEVTISLETGFEGDTLPPFRVALFCEIPNESLSDTAWIRERVEAMLVRAVEHVCGSGDVKMRFSKSTELSL